MRNEDAAVERMIRTNQLLDAYGALLTDKQRQFMQMHYQQDQSFGEIANEFGVSRQAVHDSVKHAEDALEELEAKLGLVQRGARADEKREIAEKILGLKQRIQQHGIIYNADWILRELDGIVEGLVGREEPAETEDEPPPAGAEELTQPNV